MKRIVIVLAVIIAGFVASATPAMAMSSSTFRYNVQVIPRTAQYSKSFSTSAGAVYVSANLTPPTGCPDKPDYTVAIQKLTQGTWVTVTAEKTHTANGNLDVFGFDASISKGGTYRVRVYNKGSLTLCNAHGSVFVSPQYNPDKNGK
jgi:hypothetical protein